MKIELVSELIYWIIIDLLNLFLTNLDLLGLFINKVASNF